MELDDLRATWIQHEKKMVENTRVNKELLRKLLIIHAGKCIDWLKFRSLASLILTLTGIVFIVIPRIQFTLRYDVVIGILLFGSTFLVTYIWAVRFYLLIEKLNFNDPVLSVKKRLKLAEKYKLKITRYGFILAPFMIAGIFLSAGIPFLSVKMIPFYVVVILVFLVSTYISGKHGSVAQIRNIDRDLEEIVKLEG
jgi:hypothetical protein